jgi:hypothetical protein
VGWFVVSEIVTRTFQYFSQRLKIEETFMAAKIQLATDHTNLVRQMLTNPDFKVGNGDQIISALGGVASILSTTTKR